MKAPPPKRSARPGTSTEVVRLRAQLADSRAALRAIQDGAVDALVVEGKGGPRVFTLDGAEFDYRILIESMNEGALVLTRAAVILYANTYFASMVERPLAQLMGCSLYDLVSAADAAALRAVLKRPGRDGAKAEVLLQRSSAAPLPVRLSTRPLADDAARGVSIGMVVSDLSESRAREELLRQLSQRLIRVQESERLQIASDLGDNITQRLCSILVRCELLAGRLPTYDHGLRQEAIEFARLLRSTASEVQRMSTDLRPHGMEILGLESALRGVAAEFGARVGLSIKVSCAKLSTRLPAAAELALYRVLQEALRNVEQHARARHVTVTLSERGSVVRLTIKDDGIGFDALAEGAKQVRVCRLGLLSMRERATAVGGSLKLKSSPSRGTEVSLQVPRALEASPVE